MEGLNMRLSVIKVVLALLVTVLPSVKMKSAEIVHADSLHHAQQYKNFWQNLVPRQLSVQYAGSIGVMSFGLGWQYYKEKWETDVLLGWIPSHVSDETKPSLTIKERFIPWQINVGKHFRLEPLTTGVFLNTIFGENFWHNEPSRYPTSYYGFSTNVRVNAFVGQRFKYVIPSNRRSYSKSISVYYELSTCDLYVVSAITNRRITLGDILSLAIGVKLEIY